MLVEDGEALRTMAAYIDLNPVRAGMVEDPKEVVERAFKEKREWFGTKRKTGAQGLPVEGEGLFSLRDLKVQAFE